MTRETKAGLVVSCSFLCLVGLVFYCKLNGTGNSSADLRAEAASVEVPPDPVAISENESLESNKQTTDSPTGAQPPTNPGAESMNLASAPGDTGKSKSDNTSSGGQENQNNDSWRGNHATESSQAPAYQIPTPEGDERNNTTSSSSSTDPSSSETSSKEKSSEETSAEVKLGPIQEKKGDISKASLSLNADEQTKQAAKDGAAADSRKSEVNSSKQPPGTFSPQASESATQAGKDETSGNAANSGLDMKPPPVPSQYKDKDPYHTLPEDPPKAASPAAAPQAPGKYVRDQGLKKSPPTEAPGIKLHVPVPVPETAQSKAGNPGLTPGVMPSPLLTSPPAGDTAPEPRVQLGRPTPAPLPSSQLAQGPTEAQQNAPGGFSAPVTSAPLTRPSSPLPGKPGQPGPLVPRVESYDEETYICKAGDTFAGISTRYYYTDKYALALLRFNRNHPLAAVGIAQEPPVLQAGQPVYIPPLRILEKQYLSVPADPNPITQVGAPSPAPIDPRNPALPSVPAVTMPPGKSWSTPSGERTYQVPDKGEVFLEIAKKTLGNAERWGEIYRLNPQYDPKYVIPAGTTLRLPADARVETPVPEKKQPASEPKAIRVYPN